MNKTFEIKDLVEYVLGSWSRNFDEDIILNVCQVIENTPELLSRYRELCNIHSTNVTNQSIGRYVKQITGGKSIRKVDTDKCKLIGSYTKLYF